MEKGAADLLGLLTHESKCVSVLKYYGNLRESGKLMLYLCKQTYNKWVKYLYIFVNSLPPIEHSIREEYEIQRFLASSGVLNQYIFNTTKPTHRSFLKKYKYSLPMNTIRYLHIRIDSIVNYDLLQLMKVVR